MAKGTCDIFQRMEDEHIAIHEAAHTVAGDVLGINMAVVSIAPAESLTFISFGRSTPRVSLRREFLDALPEEFRRREVMRRAMVLVAGQVGEKLAGFRKRFYRWSKDYGEARDLVVAKELLIEAEKRVEKLLQDHWPAVEALAAALVERRYLEEDQFRPLIEDAVSLNDASYDYY